MPQGLCFEQGGVVGIAASVRAGRSWVRIPVGTRFFVRNVQIGPRAHLASYSEGTGVLSQG
jgi:hypothetical protein